MKRRIGLIGLGMAVTPHAKGLVDLADRVEVAWAASRTQARCDDFAAQFEFPTTTDLASTPDFSSARLEAMYARCQIRGSLRFIVAGTSLFQSSS